MLIVVHPSLSAERHFGCARAQVHCQYYSHPVDQACQGLGVVLKPTL